MVKHEAASPAVVSCKQTDEPGVVMAEGLRMQARSSAFIQEPDQDEAGPSTRSEYCKELLMRGGVDLSFEELRAERYFQNRDREIDEKMKHLKQARKQLSQELDESQRLLLRSQQKVHHEASNSQTSDCGRPPAAASFQIYDEYQPARNSAPSQSKLQDDVFLGPDEKGLCLKIQGPCRDHNGGTTEDQTPPHPPSVPQKVSKVPERLSPIQETSVGSSSLTSLGRPSAEFHSSLEDQEAHPTYAAAAGSVDPCDPDVRLRLLELCDVASSPDLHSEGGLLPAVQENSSVHLGGNIYFNLCRVVDEGTFCVYKGVTANETVLIKVDSCSVPWDFHQFSRLKKSFSKANVLPRISCFLFQDGCITVYSSSPDHMFTELNDCDPSDVCVWQKAITLLHMVRQLHSARLLHAALQPHILAGFRRDFLSHVWVFPLDWSLSVDLDLQQDVTSVQQLPSALSYIRVGLLDPTAPPQLVDLVGVAETVHLLLTSSKMVLVKDDSGWTAERFRGREPCDRFSRMWRMFFRALLNADGPSSQSVLSALAVQMLAVDH